MGESEKSDVAHPHDLLVRNVLADADLTADLLRNYLDPELVSSLDLDSLKREAGEAVSSKLSEVVGDLRYSTRFKDSDKELKVLVLVEHQSRPDRFMAFRMLEYVCAAYRQQFSSMKKGECFPYPLMVVLHHGESPWKKLPPMRELIDMTPAVEDDILKLPIRLIDAAAMSVDELRGHPMVCALLDSLQSASTGRLPERLIDIFSRLRNVHGEDRLKSWSTALGAYYAAVQGKTRKSVDALFQALKIVNGAKEAKKMTATIADGWREEGIAIGEAKSIVLFLESRFGEVPASVQKKLRNIRDGGRVEKMIKLAATCQSLKEFQKAL